MTVYYASLAKFSEMTLDGRMFISAATIRQVLEVLLQEIKLWLVRFHKKMLAHGRSVAAGRTSREREYDRYSTTPADPFS
jgi:hypothetical protein